MKKLTLLTTYHKLTSCNKKNTAGKDSTVNTIEMTDVCLPHREDQVKLVSKVHKDWRFVWCESFIFGFNMQIRILILVIFFQVGEHV